MTDIATLQVAAEKLDSPAGRQEFGLVGEHLAQAFRRAAALLKWNDGLANEALDIASARLVASLLDAARAVLDRRVMT